MPNVTPAVANTALDALDAVWHGGVLEARSGPRPAAAANANAGTVLASVTIGPDLYSSAAAASKALVAALTLVASAVGTIGHLRLRQAGDSGSSAATSGQHRADFSVATSGSPDVLMSDNVIAAVGQQVTVSALPLSLPLAS